MKRRAVGPEAWLIDDVAEPAAWAAAVRALGLDGIQEIVPAETTVLVVCDRSVSNAIGTRLDAVTVAPAEHEERSTSVTIDVEYDGPDLAWVAEATGLGVDDVIERHASGVYSVAFCGFSPGFAYMTGLDPALHLERRRTPRTRVPAGSVAIAAAYTSVYPSPSPGGWHLLGRTGAALWDTGRADPALLAPGTVVRIRRVHR